MKAVSEPRVLSFTEARAAVDDYCREVRAAATEKISLDRSLARYLAEEICADRDQPPFSRSTRDGYAVRSAELAKVPVRLKVVGELRAGAAPETAPHRLASGETLEIMTGAALPAETDAVLMREHVRELAEGWIEALRTVEAGENVVPRGAESLEGDVVLPAGVRMNAPRLAVAASVGHATVTVYRRPQVAVLTTGDELVPVHGFPGPTQIRNSNLYSLAAQIELAGGEPVPLPIAPDHPRQLRQLIAQALQYDLALFSGGVSLGKYDLVEQALSELKAEFFFTGALIQPGKPIVFGEAPVRVAKPRGSASAKTKSPSDRSRSQSAATRRAPFFGLPGNPVSTMVTFELFVLPVLRALAGGQPQEPRFANARLKSPFQTRSGLTRFLPAVLRRGESGVEVELLAWRGSGDVVACSRGNCYLVVPPDREQFNAGDRMEVLIPQTELA